MFITKHVPALFCLFLAAAFVPDAAAHAQGANALHVVKSDINAESENAELCLEFDKALTPASPARLASALTLQADGKTIAPQNIAATGTSLCLFPLERGTSYRLNIAGLRGEGESRMTAPYSLSFTVPDRSPSLAFTGPNGGVNGFGSYDNALTLRAVNVDHARLEIYRVTDIAAMARAWQDRAQAALAPSESAYLARNKGQQIWHADDAFDAAPNITAQQTINLRDKMPDLAPGLYLLVADAGNDDEKSKPASKGLAPLAAAWFTKSDFTIRAIHDADNIHIFATQKDSAKPKAALHLNAMNKKPESLAEAQTGIDGAALIAYPPNLADKNDLATMVAADAAGNVAFADIENLPALASAPALGTVTPDDLFAVPGNSIAVSLSLIASENKTVLTEPSLLHISRGTNSYGDFPVPAPTNNNSQTSFAAPAMQGQWKLRWQKNDGAVLADTKLRVTTDADMPHLEMSSDREVLTGDGQWPVNVKSLTSSGKIVPLVGGHVTIAWQKLDPAAFGWKDYRFGTQAAILDAPIAVADFLTDSQGETSLHLTIPARPPEPGLYQAVLKIKADADSGVADATPLTLPLRPDATVIGIKPLSADARFTQNAIAHFALVALSSDGKPRDISGLSYQVYEEGRNFDWYQDEGSWKYKPEPQLRPIGGGDLNIKADRDNILEWPVTAGNYRLAILDPGGKILAQTTFSAGWDSTGATAAPTEPLSITMPKTLQPNGEVTAHINLPEAAMLTVIIADTRIRKSIHEFRPKGDNLITFTPAADWQQGISVTAEALPPNNIALRGVAEATLAQSKLVTVASEGASIITTEDPGALVLHKGDSATVAFGIENKSDTAETYNYAFTATPGLHIDNGKGSFSLAAHQSRSLFLPLSGEQIGTKELRLEITGTHTPRLNGNWTLDVMPKDSMLRSLATIPVEAGKPLFDGAKPHNANEESIAFVSRRPMNGLAEILTFVFAAHPFTTVELAASIDALRLWRDTLAQTGLASVASIEARRHEQMIQLLTHQNSDGGFASYRGGDSVMDDTAAALTSLGADTSATAKPARDLAVGWLKQQLANTWYDDKERNSRAAAYAALAAADAIDPASLHYFSDTSATSVLSPIADAHIAAAFKHMRDPNAAAFWIKKMIDENPHSTDIALLNALAATDALSSDDVHTAMDAMTAALQKGGAPSLTDAATLLRAVATDNDDAGKGRMAVGNETHDIAGVTAFRLAELTTANYRNGGDRSLSVTIVTSAPATSADATPVTRHIYRLNGVELSPSGKPAHGEIYMVELKGALPSGEQTTLVQDSAAALRPMGCPLSNKLDTPAFIPWFSTHDLTTVKSCEFAAHTLNAVLAPSEDDKSDFTIVYFAHIDASSVTSIAPPHMRVLK